MKNYISKNIEYLVKKNNTSQNDFGQLFNLGPGIVNSYITKNVIPKIDTIQKICSHANILIDDFINSDLSQKSYAIREGKLIVAKEQQNEEYSPISPRYVEQLEKALKDKERIITALEESLKDKEKLIQSLENKKNQKSA